MTTLVRMVKPIGALIGIEKGARTVRSGRDLFGLNARSNRKGIIANYQGYEAMVP